MKDKATSHKQVKATGGLGEAVRTIIYALLIAILVRTFAYEPFNIPSGSMIPTLLIGDYLFVSKFSYGYSRYSFPFWPPPFSGRIFGRQPQRGDVVVFKQPANPSTDFIKRLIGLPGDKIQVIGSTLYVNGVAAKRAWVGKFIDEESGSYTERQKFEEVLPNGVKHAMLLDGIEGEPAAKDCPPNTFARSKVEAENTCVFIVPPNTYFMMGDNRDNSSDSRWRESGVGFVPAENLVGRAEFIFFSSNGSASWWEIWKWPTAIRYDRLFKAIQ
jgi:signal peptidase I